LIIRCEKCATTFHLDQKLIEPFGSKVRCSRCGHIFWVEPPSFTFSEAPEVQNPSPKSEVPFPFQEEEEEEAAAMQIQPAGKILWTLGTIAAVILLALMARFFYIQYQHPNWSFTDTLSKVFFFKVDPDGNQKLSLINVKKYRHDNLKIGRMLVVEGEVKNGYPFAREKVIIRASLLKAGKKVLMSREVQAGWMITAEELETLSLDEINRLQSSQTERFNTNTRILPGKTLPFIIIFPPILAETPQDTIEVVIVSSQKVEASLFHPLNVG
jgi:predicted Zn finger-like uncharacterized protein